MACRERTGRLFSHLEIFKAAGLTKLVHGNHFNMCSKFILILLLITWTHNGSCISLKQQQRKQSRLPLYDGTSYDYDYGLDRPAWPFQKDASSEQTQGPLVRYFNNLMRNMRLNMPTITWKATNPLANLFNAGAPNVMESPVTGQHYDYVPNSIKHSYKSSGKRGNSAKRDKHRKVTQTQVRHEEAPATAAPKYRQYMLPAFPSGVDPMKTMYFYDPNTKKYFELQGMRSRGHFVQDNYYYNKDNYYDEENESHDSEGMDFEDSAAHEQNPKENADSTGSVSDSSEVYEEPDTHVNSESAEDESDDISNDEENTIIKQFHHATKREESLRNVIGSYMSDDRLSRQRQKAKPKYATGRRNAERVEGRNKYKYYFLEPY